VARCCSPAYVHHAHADIASSVVLPDVVVGGGAKIKRAIIDRGCVIPEGMQIGQDAEEDRENGFRVTKGGVVLVTRGMLGQAEGHDVNGLRAGVAATAWRWRHQKSDNASNSTGDSTMTMQEPRDRNTVQWKREHR
jgi:NDP-sugar pyrophosphorylase family protein